MIKRIIIRFIVVFIIFRVIIFSKIDLLTLMHSNEFKDEYNQTHMLSGHPKPKVMEYSPNSAKVYYVNKDGGDVLWFEKNDNKWIMINWETVWSSSGSADGFIWPFIFDPLIYNSFFYKDF